MRNLLARIFLRLVFWLDPSLARRSRLVTVISAEPIALRDAKAD